MDQSHASSPRPESEAIESIAEAVVEDSAEDEEVIHEKSEVENSHHGAEAHFVQEQVHARNVSVTQEDQTPYANDESTETQTEIQSKPVFALRKPQRLRQSLESDTVDNITRRKANFDDDIAITEPNISSNIAPTDPQTSVIHTVEQNESIPTDALRKSTVYHDGQPEDRSAVAETSIEKEPSQREAALDQNQENETNPAQHDGLMDAQADDLTFDMDSENQASVRNVLADQGEENQAASINDEPLEVPQEHEESNKMAEPLFGCAEGALHPSTPSSSLQPSYRSSPSDSIADVNNQPMTGSIQIDIAHSSTSKSGQQQNGSSIEQAKSNRKRKYSSVSFTEHYVEPGSTAQREHDVQLDAASSRSDALPRLATQGSAPESQYQTYIAFPQVEALDMNERPAPLPPAIVQPCSSSLAESPKDNPKTQDPSRLDRPSSNLQMPGESSSNQGRSHNIHSPEQSSSRPLVGGPQAIERPSSRSSSNGRPSFGFAAEGVLHPSSSSSSYYTLARSMRANPRAQPIKVQSIHEAPNSNRSFSSSGYIPEGVLNPSPMSSSSYGPLSSGIPQPQKIEEMQDNNKRSLKDMNFSSINVTQDDRQEGQSQRSSTLSSIDIQSGQIAANGIQGSPSEVKIRRIESAMDDEDDPIQLQERNPRFEVMEARGTASSGAIGVVPMGQGSHASPIPPLPGPEGPTGGGGAKPGGPSGKGMVQISMMGPNNKKGGMTLYLDKLCYESRACVGLLAYLNAKEKCKVEYVNTTECGMSNDVGAFNFTKELPTLDDNGFVLWEARAVMRYLVYKFHLPDHTTPLYPNTRRTRARIDRILDFDCNKLSIAQRAAIDTKLHGGQPSMEDRYEKHMQTLNQYIGSNKYVAATDKVSLADFAIAAALANAQDAGYSIDKHSQIANYWKNIQNECPYFKEKAEGAAKGAGGPPPGDSPAGSPPAAGAPGGAPPGDAPKMNGAPPGDAGKEPAAKKSKSGPKASKEGTISKMGKASKKTVGGTKKASKGMKGGKGLSKASKGASKGGSKKGGKKSKGGKTSKKGSKKK